jgi:hypothetical protein
LLSFLTMEQQAQCLSGDRFPNPPHNQACHNPWQQGSEDQEHQQQHRDGEGRSLGDGLRLIGHEAPSGDQCHRGFGGTRGGVKGAGNSEVLVPSVL